MIRPRISESMTPRQQISRALRPLEAKAQMVDEWRDSMKNDNGRLTEDGKAFVMLAKKLNYQQAWIAKYLDVSPSAINYHYNK